MAFAQLFDSVSALIVCLIVLSSCSDIFARAGTKRHWAERKTTITDFRYNSVRIDGITRLYNDSLIVISNDYYWILDKNQLPHPFNVKGHISQLYPEVKRVDAIWTDPYNDISPQIYIASNTAKRGLHVACQEFFEQFSTDSSFCHLPVDKTWKNALKDLDFTKQIDAVTWRNRTKDKDGGFWVFFQGNKMITIDPYEMHLRFTYDINKWMSINESITAAFYDYRSHQYHFFFDNNLYRTWTVNVSYMNSLPMSWDRAFLHGTLSKPMRINRDFFGFSERELRKWPQPYYRKITSTDDDDINNNNGDIVGLDTPPIVKPTTSYATTTRTRPNKQSNNFKTTSTTTENSLSDVLYITPKNKFIYNANNRNERIRQNDEVEKVANTLEQDNSEIRYQKQLMELDREGVLDFAQPHSGRDLNGATLNTASGTSIQISIKFICQLISTVLILKLFSPIS